MARDDDKNTRVDDELTLGAQYDNLSFYSSHDQTILLLSHRSHNLSLGPLNEIFIAAIIISESLFQSMIRLVYKNLVQLSRT